MAAPTKFLKEPSEAHRALVGRAAETLRAMYPRLRNHPSLGGGIDGLVFFVSDQAGKLDGPAPPVNDGNAQFPGGLVMALHCEIMQDMIAREGRVPPPSMAAVARFAPNERPGDVPVVVDAFGVGYSGWLLADFGVAVIVAAAGRPS